MKYRIFNVITCIILIALALSSCQQGQSNSTQSNSTEKESTATSEGEVISTTDADAGDDVLANEPPASEDEYSFDSYEELKSILDGTNKTESNTLRENQSEYGAVYQKTLNAFESKALPILIPHINGNAMELRNAEGLSNITLMTNELYNLPWIWYHCKVGDQDLRVKISYVSVLNDPRIDNAKSFLDILSIIAPDAPSPSNYKEKPAYKNIYEQKIIVDGQTVSALISELKDSDNVYVMFHINGVLVSLKGNSELFTDKLFASFSLK